MRYSLDRIAVQRKMALKYLLPDTCQVVPEHGENKVISGVGILTSDPPIPREYNGSTAIPCRVDLSRAFRPANLPTQVTAVDEFTMEFPADFFIEPSDRIHVGNRVFVARKLKQISAWEVTHEVTITELGVELDKV